MTSLARGLSCSRCDRTFDHREPHNLCVCGSPLLVDYDLERLWRNAKGVEIPPE